MFARILVLGSGGREHALAWRLAGDPDVESVVVASGNDGMARHFRRLAVRDTDPAEVVDLAERERITLVVVGPEAPLAAGVSDALAAAGIAVFGASRAAARIESSKWFAKELMREAGVATPAAEAFSDVERAVSALADSTAPWVVKADGLAAGKGVLVTRSRPEAEAFVRACLEGGRFGDGGRRVLLEAHVAGEEASAVAICDGERHVLLPAARDHKRAFDGDRGPNTGGMGAYAPTPAVTPELEQEISSRIVTPVLRALARRGTPYRGALYAGLMLPPGGVPQVIEFNARFGDPETQCTLPLLQGSFATLLASAARGSLDADACTRGAGAAVTVALVDEGYPDAVHGGGVIHGLDEAEGAALVFHAGTRREGDAWVVRGGRAAYITAVAMTLAEARTAARETCSRLGGSGWRCRTDIAEHVPNAMGVA